MSTQLKGMSTVLATAARIVFALPFLMFGIVHLAQASQMAPMVPLPAGTLWVVVTGLCMILAAISLAADRMVWLSMPLLAALLVVYIVVLHVPQAMDPETQMQGMQAILKNVGLIGGALAFSALYPRGHRAG